MNEEARVNDRSNDIVYVYERIDGRWDWRRAARNSKTVSTSGGQGYERAAQCEEMARCLNPGVRVVRLP